MNLFQLLLSLHQLYLQVTPLLVSLLFLLLGLENLLPLPLLQNLLELWLVLGSQASVEERRPMTKPVIYVILTQ